ncbi:sulfatase family protein [Pelagicoccus mobilis]|uniref:Sulfatase-like hydrolase/transferase n=1 Tax=Pelagicoccus mobilis TaxID=415221 RepID=A0A934VPY9_9BACT|nr:sulfatase-like hydrolase/transferase [Pelagicoccus mobilis]MBK1876023.1 sulfatase-like hydrolase/transferase [Pelagicoccus mobilis]
MKKFGFIAAALACTMGALAEKAYLDNGQVRLGIDLERGGTICFLSDGADAEKDNMVNIHDLGRYIQQSYYGGEPIDRRSEGQHANYSPWTWNPIQAGGIGSVANPPHPNSSSEILEFKRSEDSMYIKCVPRLWDMPGEAAECVFEQWMWLEGSAVRVRNKVTVQRTDDTWEEGVVRDQELPAVYPIARLRHCYTYTGDAPWTGDETVRMPDNPEGYRVDLPPTDPNGFPWNRFTPTEPWAACVNPKTGKGFGVYSPRADATWLCGFVNLLDRDNYRDGSMANSTSYIAPLTEYAMNKDSVFEYEYYLVLGAVEDVRGFAYAKEGKNLPKQVSKKASSADRPNVVVIITDDHGYADLGAYGLSEDIRTPHLDKMARKGALMTHGYVTAPQCVPSRAGIVTARYQSRFGVDGNEFVPIPVDEVTVAERLRDAGYATGFVGKWHLDPTWEGKEWMAGSFPEGLKKTPPFGIPFELRKPHMPMSKGFDDFYDGAWKNYLRNYDTDGKDVAPPKDFTIKEDEFRIDHQTDAAVSFIKRHKDEPFFLHLAYFAPHVPMEVTEKHFARFPGEMPERRRWALASIAAVDDGVGKINDTLEQLGLAENTIVFFFGDNGAPLKIHRKDQPFTVPGQWDGSDNGPMVGEKGMISDGGVRVPYVVYWKDRIPAQVYDRPVISLDAGATALALAGVETAPGEIDGVDLVPHLTGENESDPHEALYWRFWGQSAIREGKWKYYYFKNGVSMLFDMESEEHENRNLIQKYPEIAKRLDKKLAEFRETQQRPGFAMDGASSEAAWFKHYFNVDTR